MYRVIMGRSVAMLHMKGSVSYGKELNVSKSTVMRTRMKNIFVKPELSVAELLSSLAQNPLVTIETNKRENINQ